MTEAAHSILGASSYYRWKACPGSVRLCRDLPSTSSVYAEEGTRAHAMAERALHGYGFPAEITDEMEEAVLLYVQTICDDYNDLRTRHPLDELFIEHRFDLSMVHVGMFGTADAVSWHEGLRLLRVYDFKYGKGHVVEVERNEQLMYYALGALLTLPFKPETIELVVVQPRAKHKKGPVRRWRADVMEYLDFQADLAQAARATEAADAPLCEGRHCYFCPARTGVCPLHQEKTLAKAQAEFSVINAEEEALFS